MSQRAAGGRARGQKGREEKEMDSFNLLVEACSLGYRDKRKRPRKEHQENHLQGPSRQSSLARSVRDRPRKSLDAAESQRLKRLREEQRPHEDEQTSSGHDSWAH
ncbi:hypothetical protein B0H16DRAFT_1466218 [Mycena metata]|uniref:Uncharacterized protein n=1 Tax=Mycena metata TaxID=1033252 RepID=A0AAD7I9K1_9AGAR|nr:hypothetical protein B0H16DRAFT_1466218 [Mycena metata]